MDGTTVHRPAGVRDREWEIYRLKYVEGLTWDQIARRPYPVGGMTESRLYQLAKRVERRLSASCPHCGGTGRVPIEDGA